MYFDRSETIHRGLKHLVYGDPQVLGQMIVDLTDKINMMSDRLDVVTDLYAEALSFNRRLSAEDKRQESKMDLVERYLKKGGKII